MLFVPPLRPSSCIGAGRAGLELDAERRIRILLLLPRPVRRLFEPKAVGGPERWKD